MASLLGKLSLWRKIVLIIGSFALPVGILAYFTFSSVQESISFARLELCGTIYNRPLTDLLRNISAHQVLLQRYLTGEKQLIGDISARQSQIDSSFRSSGSPSRRCWLLPRSGCPIRIPRDCPLRRILGRPPS